MQMQVDLVQQAAPVVPHIKHVAPHVVQHVTHVAPIIHKGFSMLQTLIASAVSIAIGFGAGWYVKGRGLTGVKNDATNAVTTTENVITAVKTAA